jgi:predicted amidohydrolase YtcJ
MPADLVVLTDDFFVIEEQEMPDLRSVLTMVWSTSGQRR